MKNILGKLQQYVVIVGLVGAIGGGFYTWGTFNNRLDVLEKKKSMKVIDIVPLKESITEVTTKTTGIEKRLDRLERRMDTMGNNDNPLAN